MRKLNFNGGHDPRPGDITVDPDTAREIPAMTACGSMAISPQTRVSDPQCAEMFFAGEALYVAGADL